MKKYIYIYMYIYIDMDKYRTITVEDVYGGGRLRHLRGHRISTSSQDETITAKEDDCLSCYFQLVFVRATCTATDGGIYSNWFYQFVFPLEYIFIIVFLFIGHHYWCVKNPMKCHFWYITIGCIHFIIPIFNYSFFLNNNGYVEFPFLHVGMGVSFLNQQNQEPLECQ